MAIVKTLFSQVSRNTLFMLVILRIAILHLGAIQRKRCSSIYFKWTSLLLWCIRGMIGKYSSFLIWRNKMVFQWKTFPNKISLRWVWWEGLEGLLEFFHDLFSDCADRNSEARQLLLLGAVWGSDHLLVSEDPRLNRGFETLESSEFSWAQAPASFSFLCHTLEL